MSSSLNSSPVWHPFTQAKTAPPPLKVLKGNGVILELEDGRQLIDCISSWWVNVHGHCNAEIAKAIYEQAQLLEHVIFAGYTHEPAETLAHKILEQLPPNLKRVFFSDNGTTAVEVALKMSYQYWQNIGQPSRRKFITFDQGYHGETVGAMSLGQSSAFFNPFADLLFAVDSIPFPATWDSDSDVLDKEEASLAALSKLLDDNATEYAAMIIEPLVQGAGGMRMCRAPFLQALEKMVREAGILLIYDEVMTGFGRTGDLFACNKSNTHPDIICLSKGLTGGFLPLALTIATENIYQSFYNDDLKKAFFHSHSYTGNALACAAANASMNLLLTNKKSFAEMELKHRHYMNKYLASYKCLARFRFCGTIAAFDFITDEATHYFHSISLVLRERFLEQGLLMRPLGNTIYLMPPYCIADNQLESIYQSIALVIQTLIPAKLSV